MLSLQGDSELLHRIRGSRSWRFTRPLRFAARAMRGDVTRQDRALIRRWWMSKLAATRLLSFSFRGGKWRVVRGAVRVTGETVHYLHANGAGVPSQPGPSASARPRSEEHTSELQSLMHTPYAVFRLKNTIAAALTPHDQRVLNLYQLKVPTSQPQSL